jgi:hypothetical protein
VLALIVVHRRPSHVMSWSEYTSSFFIWKTQLTGVTELRQPEEPDIRCLAPSFIVAAAVYGPPGPRPS